MVAVIHKFVTSWCDLQIKGVVFFEGDINSIYHSAEFSISVSMLYQSSQKFYVYWYWSPVELLPEHHLHHTIVVHILHLLTERNNRILCMASNVL